LEENIKYLPLLENTGNESNILSYVILFKFLPLISIMYILNGNPASASKLEEKRLEFQVRF